MTTDVATIDETGTDLVPGQVGFNSAQKAMLAQLGLSDAPEGDLVLFSHVAQKSGLDPFRREIYMIGRNTQVTRYVPNTSGEGQHKETRYETVYTIQTGIQGFRKRARELADAKGEKLGFDGPYWAGDDGEWREVWPATTAPVAAKYVVFRNGEPVPAVCHYSEYVQEAGTGAERGPNSMWTKMPRNQLAKCAEALAIQRAFPDELSGLLLEDAVQDAQVINDDGSPAEQPRQRRGGKGVDGLRDRAEQAQRETVEGEVVDPGQGGGNDQDQSPEPSRAELLPDSGDQDSKPRTPMRKALEKRLFALISEIDPPLDRDDRIVLYRGIFGDKAIGSTDDLNDVQVGRVADFLFQWKKDGEQDDKIRDILNAATLTEETQKEQSCASPTWFNSN